MCVYKFSINSFVINAICMYIHLFMCNMAFAIVNKLKVFIKTLMKVRTTGPYYLLLHLNIMEIINL